LNIITDSYNWLRDRIPLDSITGYFSKKTVPRHKHSFWYYWGGLTLFCLIIQVVTGVLLLLYYKPSTEDAYASIQYIMEKVPFGSVIRSLHSWSANAMIFCILVHMFSTFFMKAYRKPRELMWMTGFLLLLVTLGFGFTGYLLPWDEVSFFATQIGITENEKLPLIGHVIGQILRGGDEVTSETLSRMFAIHVAVLPLTLLFILSIHLTLNQIFGTSKPIGIAEKKKPIPFFFNYVYRDTLSWCIGFAVLITLAVLYPWQSGIAFDITTITQAPAGIHPEWYFMFLFQTLKAEKYVPDIVVVSIFTLVGIFWFLVPFLDRKSSREEKGKLFTIIGIVLLLYVTGMTIMAYKSVGVF
jgi:cytochrome b6